MIKVYYSQLLKRLMIGVVYSCFSIGSTQATIPFTWIKGLYEVTKPQYYYLSPINGLVWYEQGIVENMYRYGDDNDGSIKLIKELFYLQRDQISFVPTIRVDKPASFFTPTTIGKIIAVIESYRIQPNYDDQELITTLKNLISNDIQVDSQLKDFQAREKQLSDARKMQVAAFTAMQKDIKQLIQRINTQKNPEKKEELIKQKNAQEQALSAVTKQLNTSKIELDPIKSKIQLLKKAPANLDLLATVIAQSMKESVPGSAEYTEYATEQIFLALLWAKSNPRGQGNPRQDFVDFFSVLASYIQQDALQQWVQSQEEYMAQNNKAFIQELTLASSFADIVMNNYEKAIFSVRAFQALEQPLPRIFSGTMVYYTHTDGKTYDFSDCGETSLRNFFDIIIYDKEKQILNIDFLIALALKDEQIEGIQLKLSDKLVKFYQKYKKLTNLTARQLYDEWTQVVENLEGVSYQQPKGSEKTFYEMSDGLPNLLKVLNHLLFANDLRFDALSNKEKIDLIVSKLSRDNFVLTWDAIKNKEKETENGENDEEENEESDQLLVNDHQFVTLFFEINKDEATSFEWIFEKDHFVIPPTELIPYPMSNDIVISIQNKLTEKSVVDLISYNLLPGYLNKENFKGLPIAFYLNNTLISFISNILFLLPLKEDSIGFIRSIFSLEAEHPHFMSAKGINTIIRKLINSLPADDDYREETIEAIISNNVESLRDVAKKLMAELKSGDARAYVAYRIYDLKTQDKEWLDWAKNTVLNLQDVKYGNNFLFVISSILTNQAQDKELLNWAKNKLPTVENVDFEDRFVGTIISILNNHAQDKELLDWAKTKILILKNIENPDDLADLMREVLRTQGVDKELIGWVKNQLSRIENANTYNLVSIISDVLNNHAQDKELLDWAKTKILTLKNIENPDDLADLMREVLRTQGVDKELIGWVKNQLSRIENANTYNLVSIISGILNNQLQDKELLDWAKTKILTLKNIENPDDLAYLMGVVLRTQGADKELIGWVKNQLPQIENASEDYLRLIISNILNNHAQDKQLFAWIKQKILELKNVPLDLIDLIILSILQSQSHDEQLFNWAKLKVQEMQNSPDKDFFEKKIKEKSKE